MRLEGKPVHARPTPVYVNLTWGHLKIAKLIADMRARKPYYANTDDPWRKGVRPDAFYQGAVGEVSIALWSGYPVDDRLLFWGDDGWDFHIGQWRLDVKNNDKPHYDETWIKKDKAKAAIFISSHLVEPLRVEIRGWQTLQHVKACREGLGVGNRWWNYILPDTELESPATLLELLQAERGVFPNRNTHLIRYPGGKAKKAEEIIARTAPDCFAFPLHYSGEVYCEPFLGSGAVAFRILSTARKAGIRIKALLADIDYGIASLWKAVQLTPEALALLCMEYEPTLDDFYCWRDEELSGANRELPPLEAGFRKLALHRMSYAGLGAKAGGPLGGTLQASDYRIDCRWNRAAICTTIKRLSSLLNWHHVVVQCRDGIGLLDRLSDRHDVLCYADPPYYQRGEELYTHAFDRGQHEALAEVLQRGKFAWSLTYDRCAAIKRLYADCHQERLQFNYTDSHGGDTATDELLITP